MNPRRIAAAPFGVRGRSVATLPAVAADEIVVSVDSRNPSRAGHGEIPPAGRAVPGMAALVTTPLRSPVTRAPSDRANPAPGYGLSHGGQHPLAAGLWCWRPAHWGPQAPRSAAPPLAREFGARAAVAGRTCGLSGQLGAFLGDAFGVLGPRRSPALCTHRIRIHRIRLFRMRWR